MVRFRIVTLTAIGVAVPGANAATKKPRNCEFPSSVYPLPSIVMDFCITGRSAPSVMLPVKVTVSPFCAPLIGLRAARRAPSVAALKLVARADVVKKPSSRKTGTRTKYPATPEVGRRNVDSFIRNKGWAGSDRYDYIHSLRLQSESNYRRDRTKFMAA